MFTPPPFLIPTARDVERLAFEAGVSIGTLCNRAGVTSQSFRSWKFDRASPSLRTVQRLLDAGLALLAEAQSPASAPAQPRGKKAAAKLRAVTAAASQRQARRRA
jgi:hypothetical protein